VENIIDMWKDKKLHEILQRQGKNIQSVVDLTADDNPSILFYILADKLGYLLDENYEEKITPTSIELRKKINKLIKFIGPLFLSNKQVMENRNELLYPEQLNPLPDKPIELPDKPVIWIANHAIKDDTLASVLAAKRNGYIIFGSLPQFYNTFDGISAWANGVIMTNRKVSSSKSSSIKKGIKVINNGSDLIMFPEGVWNKSPNKLLLDFWPGVYRIAKETDSKIVPMAHYIRDGAHKIPNNPIHTVIDDPVSISDMAEKEALEFLRDKVATWYYLMLEKYGKTTRAELLENYKSQSQAWESYLTDLVKTASRYDKEIEYSADYRPKEILYPQQVWGNIADIKNINNNNINHVINAKKLIKRAHENDYQRRF